MEKPDTSSAATTEAHLVRADASRRCPWCRGTGHKQGPPLNHAPDTVVGVGYPKCYHCKGTGRA